MRNSFFAIVFLLTTANINAQQMSGIFQNSDADFEYLEQLDWTSFLSQDKVLNSKDFRLINLETTGVGKERLYWGIYIESALRDTIVKTKSWSDFILAKRSMAKTGYILSSVQAYALSAVDAHFIGVWYKNENEIPHKVWKLDSHESLLEKTEDMAKQQFYIQEVEVFLTPSGTANYVALYHYSSLPVRNYVFITKTEKTFKEDYRERFESRVRITDFEHFNAKESSYLLGVYKPGTYGCQFIQNLNRSEFNGKWEQLEKEDMKLVSWEVRD